MTGILAPQQHDPDIEYVILLDQSGNPVGQQSKSTVHGVTTPLHLAFSLYVFGPDGRVMLTRRALSKQTWPGVWTNACCGHPLPGESMTDAIGRRVLTELGAAVIDIRELLPDFAYQARDAGGIQENEICPVFAARLTSSAVLNPNPSEVMDVAWAQWSDLVAATAATAFAFSPWAIEQVRQIDSQFGPEPFVTIG